MTRFVPYDDNAHRAQFFELNVKYLTWFVDEIRVRHNIDAILMTGQTIREYVKMFLNDFTTIRPKEEIIYLLEIDGEAVGMGALKKLEDGVGEIKRMYICPEYRGRGFGKEMLERLMEKGKEFGYSTLRLETADFSTTAHHIYRSAGFQEIAEYTGVETPEWYRSHCMFMEKKL